MAFVQNFPFFCIILSMFSTIISFVMNGRNAKHIHVAMNSIDPFTGNAYCLCGWNQ